MVGRSCVGRHLPRTRTRTGIEIDFGLRVRYGVGQARVEATTCIPTIDGRSLSNSIRIGIGIGVGVIHLSTRLLHNIDISTS
jgi:hypothetical protein